VPLLESPFCFPLDFPLVCPLGAVSPEASSVGDRAGFATRHATIVAVPLWCV
jgi:hypothetical protein